MYRVNFGNGQVHYAGSLKETLAFVRNYGDAQTFIQKRDLETMEWHSVRIMKRVA